MNRIDLSRITAAVAALCGSKPQAFPESAGLPADDVTVKGDDGRMMRVIPVSPGHPREPHPKRFSIDHAAGVCYVRDADWPALRESMLRRRAADAMKAAKP